MTYRCKFIDGMAAGEKSLSELLQDLANRLDATALRLPNANTNDAMPRNPVQGK